MKYLKREFNLVLENNGPVKDFLHLLKSQEERDMVAT